MIWEKKYKTQEVTSEIFLYTQTNLLKMPSKETKMSSIRRIELLKFNLENIREYIAIADVKANITLTLLSLIVGIGLGASLISDTFEKGIQLIITNLWFLFIIVPFYILMIVYLLLSILGINSVISVYRARLELKEVDVQQNIGDIYFKHISEHPSSEEYYEGISTKTEENYEKDLAHQVFSVSHTIGFLMNKKKGRSHTHSSLEDSYASLF